jgi:hypothetical protein
MQLMHWLLIQDTFNICNVFEWRLSSGLDFRRESSVKGPSLEVLCTRLYRIGRVEDGISIHALLEWQLAICNQLLWYRLNIP